MSRDDQAALLLQASDPEIFEFGPFRLVVGERLLTRNAEPVALGSRALEILIALVQRAGDVVSHKDLVKKVWPEVTVEETSLRVHIAGLRKALGDGRDGARFISNIPGRGYCFVAPVQRSASSGSPLFPPARSSTLPMPLQRMIGRDETVRALRGEVISCRFVSIVGPGGVGKTTVAVAAARDMESDFPGAICFIDLSALQDGALVVSAIASAVGCLTETQDSLQRLLAYLADKRILLILDSCEHVVESIATLVERLFRDAPLVHVIATTREALRVEGEHIHLLQPLGLLEESKPTATNVLASPAAQLFMDRAAAGGYRNDLTDEDAPIVADICRQLDGVPLAIELTASRASTYGIAGLAQLIRDHLVLLWRSRQSVPRHQTLQAMLDWSYDLISEREKSILDTLSVFAGSFTLDMAQAVISEPNRDALQVASVVTGLVEKSLISVSQIDGVTFYRLLDTTKAYAALKLKERGGAHAVQRRHALHHAERLVGLRDSFLARHDLSSYARQIGDIRAALEWSFSETGDSLVGVALGAGAVPLFLRMSMLSECRRWCLRTLNALPEEERGTRLELGLQLSLAIASNHAHSDSAEVEAALARGLGLADAMGEIAYRLELLAGLNLYRTRLADYDGALAAAERFSAIAGELGGPDQCVTADWMLGATHHLIGNQAYAQKFYHNGFRRAATTGVKPIHSFGYDHQVRALIGYARTSWLAGFPDQAFRLALEGIEVVERQAHPVSFCICMVYAVPVFMWRGDRDIAEKLIERLVEQAAKYSLSTYHAGGLGLRGELLLAEGQTELGIETLRAALSTLQSEDRHILSASFSRALAEGLAQRGYTAEATMIIDSLIADAAAGSGTFEQPDLLRARAEVLLAESPENQSAAEDSLMRSLECARRQSALGWELRSALALGRLWRSSDKHDDAVALLASVRCRFTEGFQTADLIKAERDILSVRASKLE
jgi:predicted ATPase/DNA-binding winged helix-turn-helix (wHTH) protein